MRTFEVELASDEPEVERIDGIDVPKMSPVRTHALLQTAIAMMLSAWADGRGDVGTEWRFKLDGRRGRETSLVPDVSYVENERLGPLSDRAIEMPPFAPTIAVEIRSLGDRDRNVARKIERLLEHGGRLVLDVRPASRTIVAHAASGSRTFEESDTFEHAECPGLRFAVAAYFAKADRESAR